jgi:hypothetical protein
MAPLLGRVRLPDPFLGRLVLLRLLLVRGQPVVVLVEHSLFGDVLYRTQGGEPMLVSCLAVSKIAIFFPRAGLWIRIDLMLIRIRHFSLWLRIRIQFRIQGFDDQKTNLLILRPPERMHKLKEKPSALRKEHSAL